MRAGEEGEREEENTSATAVNLPFSFLSKYDLSAGLRKVDRASVMSSVACWVPLPHRKQGRRCTFSEVFYRTEMINT